MNLRLIAAGIALAVLVGGGWYLRHSGYQAGRAECESRWLAAQRAAERKHAELEEAIRSKAVSLATRLDEAELAATHWRQEYENARARATLVRTVEVPGPCPDLSPDFIRLWNAAAGGTASSSPGPGSSSDPVPGSEADPAR